MADESKLRLQRRKQEGAGTQGMLGAGSRQGRLLRSLSAKRRTGEQGHHMTTPSPTHGRLHHCYVSL